MVRVPDIDSIRKQFPILQQQVNGHPLVYLDNAATTQKPKRVIEAVENYYALHNANIHRGAHYLAHRATEAYEHVRSRIAARLNARETAEIIFTSGTTDSINLVAEVFGRKFLNPGDEILLSGSEHHSNIVPWQMIAEERGATIRVIPLTVDTGEWDLSQLDQLVTTSTRIVSVGHVSNALGTVNPVEQIIVKAKAVGAAVLLDGAQAVGHMNLDVQALGCDFYAFSSHKMFGPMGIGVLYGKREWLDQLPPYRGGGEMIKSVSFGGTQYNDLPYKYEAGTPNVEGVAGLGSALDFLEEVGMDTVAHVEHELLEQATEGVLAMDGIRLYGSPVNKAPVLSFAVQGLHPYDIGTLLDQQGIAVRTGHHCAQPVMDHLGIPGTVRASFAPYNTHEEVGRFISALNRSIKMLRS